MKFGKEPDASAGGEGPGGKFRRPGGAKVRPGGRSNAVEAVDRESGMRQKKHQERQLIGAFW